MAEFVQQNVEDMLPELEYMERVQLFTGKETKSILKKRKTFEYRLRRKTKVKDDYIQYIQYEMDVLDLVKKRRHRMGYKHKKMEIDIPIEQRIHRLFRIACFRFKDDVKIWLSHIKFCKMRSKRSGHGAKALISDLYNRMLQVQTRKPALWIKAAKHEMEVCQSMENARQVLQRGLRFNPQSKLLWQEYFRMELLNVEKLRMRQEVLKTAGIQEKEEIGDEVLEGRIAEIVYGSAVGNFPDDVDFRLSFLPICRIFSFAKTIEETIFKDIQGVNNESTWAATATRHLFELDVLKSQEEAADIDIETTERRLEEKCFEVFQEAVTTLVTEKMYDKYLDVCLNRMALDSSAEVLQQRRIRTLCVFEEAASHRCLSEEMALKWLTVLVETGQVEDSISKALNLVLSLHPASLTVLQTVLEQSVNLLKPYEEIHKFFTDAKAKVPAKEALPLWDVIHKWLKESHPDKLEAFLQSGLAECSAVCIPVKCWYLEFGAAQENIVKLRQIFKRITAFPPVAVEIYQAYIAAELNQDKVDMTRVRPAFEEAVREFGGKSTDLWIDYIRSELSTAEGRPHTTGDIYSRAVRSLEGELNERFITQYTLLQTGHS